jgi:hypothetical protein
MPQKTAAASICSTGVQQFGQSKYHLCQCIISWIWALFDEETMSLWSRLEGRPVVGGLVGPGLELTAFPVVTTTWREWRSAHPDTTVLSLETGFERDYSEGAAYRDYFASDGIMFEVSRTDRGSRTRTRRSACCSGPPEHLPMRRRARWRSRWSSWSGARCTRYPSPSGSWWS